jgi:hypothetical protein
MMSCLVESGDTNEGVRRMRSSWRGVAFIGVAAMGKDRNCEVKHVDGCEVDILRAESSFKQNAGLHQACRPVSLGGNADKGHRPQLTA